MTTFCCICNKRLHCNLLAARPCFFHATQDRRIPEPLALVRRHARATDFSQPDRLLRKLGLSQRPHAPGRDLARATTAGARRQHRDGPPLSLDGAGAITRPGRARPGGALGASMGWTVAARALRRTHGPKRPARTAATLSAPQGLRLPAQP